MTSARTLNGATITSTTSTAPVDGRGFCFNSDGTKLFLVSSYLGGRIYQYSLSTGFDISTAVYDGVFISISSETSTPEAIDIDDDGDRLYVQSRSIIYQYNLSTALDVSTATYSGSEFNFTNSEQETHGRGFCLTDSGSKLYIVGDENKVFEYLVSDPYNLSVCTWSGFVLDYSSETTDVSGVSYDSVSGKLHICEENNTVYEYNCVEADYSVLENEIAEFSSSLWQSDYKFSWKEINNQDVALNIYNNTESHHFFVIGDNVYNGWILPRSNSFTIKEHSGSYTAANFPDGGYPGYIAYSDKYYGIMLVWKLKDTNTYIKHTAPKIIEITGEGSTPSNYYYPGIIESTEVVKENRHEDKLLLNNENTDAVEGPFVALTVGYGNKQDADQTGSYFIVGKLTSYELNTDSFREIIVSEDLIATYEVLNIDPYSHHILGGRTIGTFASNFMLGDSVIDFMSPGNTMWMFERSTDTAFINTLFKDNGWSMATANVFASGSPSADAVYIRPNSRRTPSVTKSGLSLVNTSDKLIVKVIYNLSQNGACTLDVTGTDITNSTGNVLTAASDTLNSETVFSTKNTIELEFATPHSGSAATDLEVKLNPVYNASGDDELWIIDVDVYQSSLELRSASDIMEVTIKVKNQEFKRYEDIYLYEDSTETYFPDLFSYPDQRASKIAIWRLDSGTWYKIYEVDLNPHPSLNIATSFEENRSFTNADTASSSTSVEDPFPYTGESIRFQESEKFRSANLNEYDLLLERVYSADSEVRGFVENTNQVSDGQFGQFPLYILCENHIHAAESGSSDGVFISRITLINDDQGVINHEAFTVANNGLWFASKEGFHVLTGSQVQDIHLTLNKYDGEEDFLSTFLTDEEAVSVGFNKKTREVLFSNGYGGRTMVYNWEYNRWYEGSVVWGNGGKVIQIDNTAYLFKEGVSSNNDQFICKWRDGSDDVSVTLTTTALNFGFYGVLKRLFKAVLYGRILSEAESDLTIQIDGKKNENSGYQELIKYVFSADVDEQNLWMRSNYGSYNVYKLTISGPLSQGAYIQELAVEIERRGNITK